MKLLALLSAGLVAAAVVPAAANAQTVHHRTVVRTTTTTHTVANRHHVRHAHWRTVCHTNWRHHHKVRTCSKVRYWA